MTDAAPIVIVALRTVYGVVRAYPVNDNAKAFAALVEMKTLSREHLMIIESLGFTIEITQPDISLIA